MKNGPAARPLLAAFVGLGLGLLFLAIGLNRPTIANMRTVDLMYLLGTGACLGAGLVGWSGISSAAVRAEAARFGKAIATPAFAAKGYVPKTTRFGTPAQRNQIPVKRP